MLMRKDVNNNIKKDSPIISHPTLAPVIVKLIIMHKQNMKGHNYQHNVQHVTESTKKCSFSENIHVLYLRKAFHFSWPNICSELPKLF